MKDVRRYPEGSSFPGVIGRTVGSSTPAWPEPPRAPSGAPNVLIVLLDDVGFAQIGCFGSDIRTPTFDRLAHNGLRYRDFHTTALCTPSRACLLTGRNAHSNALGLLGDWARGFPGYNARIPLENGFLSEILRHSGYATFALGKWHLSPAGEIAPGSPRASWPLGRGFERFYGFLHGKTDQWVPALTYDNHPVEPPGRPEDGYHLNADMADRAIGFIADLRAVDDAKPFFMYYCPGAGHSPHHVPREWADRYKGQFDLGWDRWREQIFERQLRDGIMPAGTRLSARPDWISAWDSLEPEAQRVYARQMEVYAGFLEHTDHHFGRVVAFLEKLGELENTLVMITSDNGASSEGGEHGRAGYAAEYTRLEVIREHLDEWGSPRSSPNYSWGWAWAGNTPLRRWKRFLHEGGVTDPLIVSWPRGIASRGEVRDQYAHITDVMPTVLETAGIEPPRSLSGVAQSAIEGVSFAHTFGDPEAKTKKTVQYYEMLGSRAIWCDGWKAVAEQDQSVVLTEELLDAQRWELYHVTTDPSETEDLADKHPQKLRELIELWWAEAGKHGVLPLESRAVLQRPLAPRPRYTYRPQAGPLPTWVAPNVHDRSHKIVADVAIPDGGAEGVILAHGGGPHGGYALYLKDRRLQYVSSHSGLESYVVSSDTIVGPGQHALGVEFTRTGTGSGTAVLLIDGRPSGSIEVPRTWPLGGLRGDEGFCCGYDSGSAVGDYVSPFRFTGTIEKVTVDVEQREVPLEGHAIRKL